MLYSILQAGKGASDDPAGQRTKSAQKQAFYQMQKVFFLPKPTVMKPKIIEI
jgi:hypothetical protein